MLQKLLQTKDSASQAQILSKLADEARKNCLNLVKQLNEEIIGQIIGGKLLFKENFIHWLEFCITVMSVQECFAYAGGESGKFTPALKLLDEVGKIGIEDKHEKVNTLMGKYSNIEISLALHAFLARYCVTGVLESRVPRLLPIFIRLSSYIIEKYLQLRNEPAKDSEDRIQDDKVVLKNTEGWVSDNIKTFFATLEKVQQPLNKQLVLMAVGDVIGALLETDRQNLLDKKLSTFLLQKVLLSYCLKNYTLPQIHTSFLSTLHSKHLNNPLKKIQIPQIYSEYSLRKVGLNTQAYVYIMVRFLKAGLLMLNSKEQTLRVLVSGVAEILARPYQVKVEAIDLLERWSGSLKPITVGSGYEYGYPIQLLFFYLFQYEKQKYERIRSNFVIMDEEAHVSGLIILQNLPLQNLEKEKQKYILHAINKYKLYNSARVLKFFNKINFRQQKQKRQTLLLETVDKLKIKFEKQASQLQEKWKKEAGQLP